MHSRYAPTLILVLLAAGCGERAAPAADKTDGRQLLETRLKQLRADRVTAAKMAMAASLAAFQAETVTLDNILLAIDALWKAELGVANTAGQRVAAHVERIENLGRLNVTIKDHFEKGARGGEAEKMYAMRYRLADAEIALIEQCITDGVEYVSPGAPPEGSKP